MRQRTDVVQDRVGIQGWSNGAMTTLVTVSDKAPGTTKPSPATGFRAALALYPGCNMDRVKPRYLPYAPLLMLLASADDEVSPVNVNAGMSLCAGEDGSPFAITSDAVGPSLIGPATYAGFVEL